MNIPVVDHTANWREWVRAAAERWDAALAYRGIRVTYEWGAPIEPINGTPSDGLVHVTDQEPWIQGHWGDSWQWDSGPWPGGWVHLYRPPSGWEFPIACCVHELAHTMGLSHVPPGSDSVMTPIPNLAYPSASDAANAMRGYPLPVSPPPPNPPPKPESKKKHKKKRKHGKH